MQLIAEQAVTRFNGELEPRYGEITGDIQPGWGIVACAVNLATLETVSCGRSKETGEYTITELPPGTTSSCSSHCTANTSHSTTTGAPPNQRM
jgi:hypothetical protein